MGVTEFFKGGKTFTATDGYLDIAGKIHKTAEEATMSSMEYEVEKLFGGHRIYSWNLYRQRKSLNKILTKYIGN